MPISCLKSARSKKMDEFYTQYKDVKNELDHYIHQFKDKIIYCPCDTQDSAFVKYFKELQSDKIIKDLIYTSIQDGISFDSEIAMHNYNKCDVIVTNPPFSLFRKFIDVIVNVNKNFIIFGNTNAITYKVMSKLFKDNKIRVGYIRNKTLEFEVPDYYESLFKSGKIYKVNNKSYCKVQSCSAFTNFDVTYNSVQCVQSYTYQLYDNFNAINVDKVSEIPDDYYGIIGVPITYLCNPDNNKFEVLGLFNNIKFYDPENGHYCGSEVALSKAPFKTRGPVVDNQAKYARVLIKRW